ncbi:hypothetical protein V6N11_021737 [Hibiscus sabdariffa]|uniref:Secreted protein n=1 Tax=Hibiscus sabdariffa TaxID=183260 RepID=A0ABR2TH43_9ROSI
MVSSGVFRGFVTVLIPSLFVLFLRGMYEGRTSVHGSSRDSGGRTEAIASRWIGARSNVPQMNGPDALKT